VAKSLGLDFVQEEPACGGLNRIDISIRMPDGRKVAMEVRTRRAPPPAAGRRARCAARAARSRGSPLASRAACPARSGNFKGRNVAVSLRRRAVRGAVQPPCGAGAQGWSMPGKSLRARRCHAEASRGRGKSSRARSGGSAGSNAACGAPGGCLGSLPVRTPGGRSQRARRWTVRTTSASTRRSTRWGRRWRATAC
jgi:hypothetical protein